MDRQHKSQNETSEVYGSSQDNQPVNSIPSSKRRLLESGLQGVVGVIIASAVSLIVSFFSPQVFSFVINGEDVTQLKGDNSALRDELETLKQQIDGMEDRLNKLEPASSESKGEHEAIKNLLKEKVVDSNRFEMNEEFMTDSLGNRYQAGDCSYLSYWAPDDYGYAAYYLGNKYSRMSLTIAPSDVSPEGSGREVLLDILVKYADSPEYQSIYTSPEMSRSTAPIQLDGLDISGAEWVEFRLGRSSTEIGDCVSAIVANVRVE